MNDDRDILIEQAFGAADEPMTHDADAFVTAVVRRTSPLHRLEWPILVMFGAIVLPLLWLVMLALNRTLPSLLTAVVQPIAALPQHSAVQVLWPLNTVAAVVALTLFGLRVLYRRWFTWG